MKNKICIHKNERGYCIICNCYPDKEYCDSCIGFTNLMKNKICIHKNENGYCIICDGYPEKKYCSNCEDKEIKK